MQPAIDVSALRHGMPLPIPGGLKKLLPPERAPRAPWTDYASEDARDRQFVEMLRSFRETGGLARGDEVAEMLGRTTGEGVAQLARWIVTKQVLSFDWQGERWLPLFQFELATMARRERVLALVGELLPAFDPWQVGCWFAQPNSWLGGRTPVEMLAVDFEAVVQAARADRYVTMG